MDTIETRVGLLCLVRTNTPHEAPRIWTITRELSLRKVESRVLQKPTETEHVRRKLIAREKKSILDSIQSKYKVMHTSREPNNKRVKPLRHTWIRPMCSVMPC